ncbi:MAG: tyrosine-type recombinase/integrase [Oscillospiraceae bacterium]|nr:tyrosine-type recombinase/integrase [Oscillospiraceae bacterium]
MYAFNSIFKDELSEYLLLRQKAMTPESHYHTQMRLSSFDKHLVRLELSEKIVTEEMINSWIRLLSETNAKRTASEKVSCLRKFLEYLRYCDFSVFIPNCPKYSNDYVPYIFSDEEVAKIFDTADKMEAVESTSRYMLPMLLRLLYGCGLRLGETLSLRMHDVNFDNGTLLMKHAKNKKQRIVPMNQALTEILRRYCIAMRLVEKPETFLFPSNKQGKHLSQASARYAFKKVLVTAGVYIPPETPHQRNQCLHCFRHLFAVKSFVQAERGGRSIDGSVPFLSVYLGHFDMDGTEKYLKFSGDMFPEYTEMFQAYAGGVFSEVLYEE